LTADREARRVSSRRRRARRRLAGVAAFGVLVAGGVVAGVELTGGSGHHAVAQRGAAASVTSASKSGPSAKSKPNANPKAKAVAVRDVTRLGSVAVDPVGMLEAPLQDAGGAAVGGTAYLLAGLDAQDVSVDVVRSVTNGRTRIVSHLPGARHDAAAVSLGGRVYLFGGGNAVGQLDEIVRFAPGGSAAPTVVGHLPTASSDAAAAVVAGTAYIVGGYDGHAWLNTIVAWTLGHKARVVARLPVAIRYAAVAVARGRVVIAGGTLTSGAASRAVYSFTPASQQVRKLHDLPRATTHAAAGALRGQVLVIGGRGTDLHSFSDRIYAVDPIQGRVMKVGRLPAALSDATGITMPGAVLLAGGKGASGTIAGLFELRTVRRSPSGAGVYSHDMAGMLSPVVRAMPARVYVPNSLSNTVDVIDPRTYRVVEHFAVAALPQHVVPSHDLRTLYVLDDVGNALTPIDPRNGRPGKPIPVSDPYNMYFTVDGRFAIVVAERRARLDFRDPHSFRLVESLAVPCQGIDHLDFSPDGGYLLASCEFSGEVVKVDVRRRRVLGALALRGGTGKPQDVKLSPDGKIFYVADMVAGGVWEVSGSPLRLLGFLPTGNGAHGLYPSRDGRLLYVTNRDAGTISVVSFASPRVVAEWRVPGGSPDMGGVSPDGRVLWLSGRYNGEVYAISTATGRVLRRIPVGRGPHGLAVWPQPGRFSLGHTGNMR
jgi:YVTN family beta-propeller protein